MSEPIFISVDQIKILHRLALERHGGQDGVRDEGALESAALHPCNVGFIFHSSPISPSVNSKQPQICSFLSRADLQNTSLASGLNVGVHFTRTSHAFGKVRVAGVRED